MQIHSDASPAHGLQNFPAHLHQHTNTHTQTPIYTNTHSHIRARNRSMLLLLVRKVYLDNLILDHIHSYCRSRLSGWCSVLKHPAKAKKTKANTCLNHENCIENAHEREHTSTWNMVPRY